MPSLPTLVIPEGGRLCRRALREGSALVGILHLPEGWSPEEGVCYALSLDSTGVAVDPTAVSPAFNPSRECMGVGNLLERPIWNKTTDPRVLPVRFIQAFPEDNAWTVYGASHHPLPENHPTHAWMEVLPRGKLKALPAPFDAAGSGIGQMLSSHPVWPNRRGDLFTLPQTQTPWRAHFLNYHRLLVQAACDPEVSRTLETTISKSPIFREINIGRVEREFCSYLAELDARGLLTLECPQSAAEFARREQVTAEILHGGGESIPSRASRPSL